MKKIEINKHKFALVDDEDFDYLSRWKWRLQSKGYPVTTMGISAKSFLMNRIILKAKQGQQVDHINHNKLDNRKCNLRICTNSQNHMNIKKYLGKTSKYKGVYYDKSRNKWAADIKLNKKKIRLGRHEKEEDAALAYNAAAKRYFGSFALLNEIPT